MVHTNCRASQKWIQVDMGESDRMASRRTGLQKWRYPAGSSYVAFREGKPAFKKKPALGVIVPRGLYNLIQVALASRREWETKRDKPSELKLIRDENRVNTIANMHKLISQCLPSTWKYNPVTANTLVSSDDEPLAPTIIRFDEEDVEGGCKDGYFLVGYFCSVFFQKSTSFPAWKLT